MATRGNTVVLGALTIKGYRSLRNTEFSPDPNLSVLIGPNGAGKTNLLQAIELLSQLESGRRPKRDNVATRACEITATFRIGRTDILYRANLDLAPSDRNSETIVACVEHWNLKALTGDNEWVPIPFFLLDERVGFDDHMFLRDPAEKTRRESFERAWSVAQKLTPAHRKKLFAIRDFKSSIKYYSASQFTNPSRCPSSFEIDANKRVHESYDNRGPHLSFMAGLYDTSKSNKEEFESYLNIVGPKGIRLIEGIDWKEFQLSSRTVEVKTGGKISRQTKRRLLIVPLVRVGGARLSFNQLSEGTFRTLALLYYVLISPASLLLVEEPEVCVHHGLLKSVVDAIQARSKQKQIVISTHSELVLDSVLPSNVFAVTLRPARGTVIKPLSKSMPVKELEALRKYLETTGSLGEFWTHSGFN